jgi:AmmeMemoRadiSam system protein A
VSIDDQRKLLAWARCAIELAVRDFGAFKVPDAEVTPGVLASNGAFVTVKKHGELRGCIGRMDFDRPVWENVVKSAVASALDDPRFKPVRPEELPELTLEISVLDPPEPLRDISEFDSQRHGIIIQKGLQHGLLLPKVAQEYGWDAHKTLQMVCWKAGLPPSAWQDDDAHLQIFSTVDFS